MTNYELLFGTPEKTAKTLTRMDADIFNWCAVSGEDSRNCKACPYEYDRFGCYMPEDFSLLKWLESEVTR